MKDAPFVFKGVLGPLSREFGTFPSADAVRAREVMESPQEGTRVMEIASRYHLQSKLRKIVRILSGVQLVYVMFRTLWNFIPVVLGHDPVSWVDVGILVFGAALYQLFQIGFGYGRSQYEKPWAIRAYGVGSLLLLGECFVRFWLYHVQFGPNAYDPEVAAVYPRIPKSIAVGISDPYLQVFVFRACDVFEKIFEVVGLMSCTAGVYFLSEYLSSRREAEEEAERKRQ